ncbi:MAG: sugar kinase [Clostridiales bacterium]|nr:sugar kinase [Clostridiales bacterium]
MKLLSIDVGTSSVKIALMDGDCTILDSAKARYQIRTTNVDWVELDADAILAAIVEAIHKLPGARDAELVAFDNFSPSVMLMDENGDAVHSILTHLDRRSKRQTQEILSDFGKERFQAITGIQPFTGGASITSFLWLKANRPKEWAACRRIGHINTYVYKQLTGKWAIDPVNASQTGLYETITNAGWSKEICGAFSIPEGLLPEVLPAGTIAGGLTKRFAELTGLREGVPVALGTNDAASAQIGAGNGLAGDILNISGSSDMVSILTDKPIVHDKYYLRGFCLPGLWQIYVTTAGGFAVDWFRAQFYRDLSGRQFFDEEFEGAAKLCTEGRGGASGDSSADSDGGGRALSVGFTPYLAGDRQSLTPKQASFTGLTLDTTRRQMLAAVLLAMHEPMRDVMEICEASIKLRGKIKLTGGMLSPAFVDLKRRLFPAYEVEVIDDCPLIGNARLALKNL